VLTRVKTPAEIAAMRESGRMLATVLEALRPRVKAGMTTKDLAKIAADELKPLGGEPAFLGYQGFPDVICISVNDEVVHGIPSDTKILKEGDIVGLDFGVRYRGMITDAAISVIVG
jgi:methionyl aminopeptidase